MHVSYPILLFGAADGIASGMAASALGKTGTSARRENNPTQLTGQTRNAPMHGFGLHLILSKNRANR